MGANLDCYTTKCTRKSHFLCLVEGGGLIMQCETKTSTFCNLHRDKFTDEDVSEAHLEIADNLAIVAETQPSPYPAIDVNGPEAIARHEIAAGPANVGETPTGVLYEGQYYSFI